MEKQLKRIENDLKQYCTISERYMIMFKLKNKTGYREKHVIENYKSIKLDGNILRIFSDNDDYGFAIDFRKKERTFGDICG